MHRKMTQKSLEALQAAQSLAVEYEKPGPVPGASVLRFAEPTGRAHPPSCFRRWGPSRATFAAFAKKVGELPHVTGTGRDPEKVYITPELDRALTAAEKICCRHEGRIRFRGASCAGHDGCAQRRRQERCCASSALIRPAFWRCWRRWRQPARHQRQPRKHL